MPRKEQRKQNAQNRDRNNPTDTSHTEEHTDVLAASKEETCTDTGSEAVNCSHAKHYKQSTPAPNKKKGKQHSNNIILSLKCLDCVRDKAESVEAHNLWLCLHCFHSRCGRYTDNRHAVVHFEADKEHCLSLNIVNLQVWCYECDNFVLVRGKLESTVSSMKSKLKSIKPPKAELPMDIEMVEFPGESVKTGKCSSIRVIGLSNLGNTCYFNSALQNLLYLAPFKEQLFSTLHRTEYRLVPKKHPDLDPITFQYTNNGAAEPGDLTQALSSLMKLTKQVDEQEFVRGKKSAHKRFSTSPRSVQNVIARKHRKFSNGSQQDSHELLRYLIDMVKDEEIRRLKTAFLEHFDAKDHKSQFKLYSEEKKKLLRKYASEFKNIFVFTGTFIDEVFGGTLLSIVDCHTCRNTFDVNEDFLDLSLPLPVEKYDSRPRYDNDTKKQKKQMAKAAQKKLKKQNSKTYDIHTFNKKSDFPDAGKQDRGLSREETGSSKSLDSRGDKVDTNGDKENESSPVTGSQGIDSDKHLSSDMNELNIDTPTVQPLETKMDNLEGEREAEDQIPESLPDDNLREEVTEPHNNLPSIIIDDYDCRTDNSADAVSGTDNSQMEFQDTPSEELHSNPQTDPPMEVEHPEFDLSPHSTASHSDTAAQPIEGKECTVKSKRLQRLRVGDKTEYQQSSLEYYVNKFFSAETLHGDYLCVHCNPQFKTEADEDKASSSGGEGEGDGEGGGDGGGKGEDERESSGESIDLTKCHFSDVTKQFHVKSLPPILTIHLKRFSQSGFRLHKVSKQIEFPLVLDMAPFCTSDVAPTTDSDSKILYGLRGIVQHSGGLVAGHYIAYVNIADWHGHTDIKSPQTQSDKFSGNDVASTTQCEKMDTDLMGEMGEETRDCGMQVSTKEPAAEKQSHEPTGHLTTHITPSEDWYYISDSSVSKVSSYEVFRSQAYILFYERLPLIPK